MQQERGQTIRFLHVSLAPIPWKRESRKVLADHWQVLPRSSVPLKSEEQRAKK